MVDGLGGVADHHQLGVAPLVEENLLDDGIGVLGLVQQEKVCVDLRLGESPNFQVVVVIEADRAVVGVLEVGPGLTGEGDDVGGELGVQGAIFQAPQVRDVVAGDGGVGGVAEAGHRPQGGVGERSLRQVALTDPDGFGDAEGLSGLPGGAAGAFRRRV